MDISLIGYMTAGKTVIGKELSAKLSLPFQDLDERVAENENMEVSRLVRSKGELYFRKIERKVLMEVLDYEGVLSTGGGTPCYYDNIDILNQKSFVVFLQWSNKTLVQRLRLLRETRPLLDGVDDQDIPEFVAKHIFDRRPYYEQAAHIVYCDGKSVDEICNEIIDAWRK